jgi:hypothetical protein
MTHTIRLFRDHQMVAEIPFGAWDDPDSIIDEWFSRGLAKAAEIWRDGRRSAARYR